MKDAYTGKVTEEIETKAIEIITIRACEKNGGPFMDKIIFE